MSEGVQPLAGKVVLLTGGSRNLGAEVARRFAGLGANVAVNHYRDGEMAEELVQSLRKEGHNAVEIEADVSQRAEVSRLVEAAVQALGPVDILIHCAGPFAMTPFVDMPEDEWDGILDVNTKAGYMLAQQLAPGMAERGWGRIILVSAGSAYIRTHSIYSLAKATNITLTELLAVELGPSITVNAIAPGYIATDMNPELRENRETNKFILDRVSAGRWGVPADLQGAAVFLASEASAYVHGVVLPVDGGWLAR